MDAGIVTKGNGNDFLNSNSFPNTLCNDVHNRNPESPFNAYGVFKQLQSLLQENDFP